LRIKLFLLCSFAVFVIKLNCTCKRDTTVFLNVVIQN